MHPSTADVTSGRPAVDHPHGDEPARRLLAGQPDTPPDVLADLLLHDPSEDVRIAAVRNPNIPQDALHTAVEHDPSLRVMDFAAFHPAATPRTLHALAVRMGELPGCRTRFHYSPRGVAGHPNTRPDTLAFLYRTFHHLEAVRLGLARNPNTPANILQELRVQMTTDTAGSPRPNRTAILLLLAEHPGCGPDMLFDCLLAPLTRTAAGRNPGLSGRRLQEAVDHPDLKIRAAVAANPNLTAGQVETLCDDPQQLVRSAALVRPDVPARALVKAAGRRGSTALAAVARHTNTPPHVLLDLAVHPDPKVRRAALRNPACPPEARAAAWLAG